MCVKNYLLPNNVRFAGIFFIMLAIITGFIRFHLGIKPHLLDMKPFAFYSTYLEDKYLQFIGNNMSEELVSLSLLIGLFCIAFSADRVENETKQRIRTKALYITLYVEAVFGILAILFTFGFAFLYIMIANLFIPLLIFILVFRILLFNEKRKNKAKELFNYNNENH